MILIADDDTSLVEILKTKFSSLGHTVLVAHNGEEAEKTMIEQKPDVSIVDIMMPKKSGLELLQDIRNNPETKNLAVFILSNLSQPKDQERAKALGVEEYIVKVNLSLDQIVEKVDNCLKIKPPKDRTVVPLKTSSVAQNINPLPLQTEKIVTTPLASGSSTTVQILTLPPTLTLPSGEVVSVVRANPENPFLYYIFPAGSPPPSSSK